VQVLKAGVMEIADIFVVNKADRPGADKLRQEVEVMLGIRRGNAALHIGAHHAPRAGKRAGATTTVTEPAWTPPVLATVATNGEGVELLVDAIEAHGVHLKRSGELEQRRRRRLVQHTREVVDRGLRQMVWQGTAAEQVLGEGIDRVVQGADSPYDLARRIIAGVKQEGTDG
jgi:LAO/AO transport system kinase